MADPGPSTAVPQHATPDLHTDYIERRDEIARCAAGSGQTPAEVAYRPEEDRTWAIVITTLHRLWEGLAAPEIVRARDRIRLATDRVPQLTEVTAALEPRSGFVFEAVPGLVGVDDFFGALGAGRFLSTQYIRHHEAPLYTPEPDIIHEVIGHGTCLAQPHLAMLHREAGSAMMRMTSDLDVSADLVRVPFAQRARRRGWRILRNRDLRRGREARATRIDDDLSAPSFPICPFSHWREFARTR